MSKTKAIIVGVSNYMHNGANTLPFCQNDIMAIKDAFVHGLNVQPEDIIVCGENGSVEKRFRWYRLNLPLLIDQRAL